jgi:hypothetical protein
VETKQPDQDTFQTVWDLEQIIAEGLWEIRPQDLDWDKIVYNRNQTGGTGDQIVFILSNVGIKRAFSSKEITFAADDLREMMYQLGKGAWLAMTLTITPGGDGWEATYNYTEKPEWPHGEPSGDDYAQELYVYPRDEEHIPDWFREELKTATWTPED